MLLVGAGLLLQSFARLTHVPVGFKADGLLTMRVSLPTSKYADPAAMRSFMTRLMPKLEAMPGVAQRGRVDGAAAGDHDDGAVRHRRSADGRDRRAAGRAVVGDHAGLLRDDGDSARGGRAFTAARQRTVAAGGRGQPGSRAPRVAERVADRQEAARRPVSRLRRSRRRRRRREEQRSRAGADAAMYTPYAQRPWPTMQFARARRPAAIRWRS